MPVEVKVRREVVAFDTDEHPKATTPEALAGLKTVFRKDGSVTAGNASGDQRRGGCHRAGARRCGGKRPV